MEFINKLKKFKMEIILVIIIIVLCIILFCNILRKLRQILPYRVNCWSCNSNCWIKFPERNSWTCVYCDQYNGFTKDGDYNKQLVTTNEVIFKTPKSLQRNSPQNGLCKMCNINQELKVAQLANFVPMNEKNFDEEVEIYRLKLEKAYKLCRTCKKTLQVKLNKEKENLLGFKLIESRTPEKKDMMNKEKFKYFKIIMNTMSVVIAGLLLLVVSVETFKVVRKNDTILMTSNNIMDILSDIVERLYSVAKMKTLIMFPSAEQYAEHISNTKLNYLQSVNSSMTYMNKFIDDNIDIIQKTLGAIGCMVQILGHLLTTNIFKYAFILDILWTVFVICSLASIMTVNPLLICFIKMICTIFILKVSPNYRKNVNNHTVANKSPKRIKNLVNRSINSLPDDSDSDVKTDDDVSLHKFGLNNIKDSSNETINTLCNGLTSGVNNSSYSVNAVESKAKHLNMSDNVFMKPTFQKYQKISKDDYESDLDESLSCLNIGSPEKRSRLRPVISPSILIKNWVAGGYWGQEKDKPIFNLDGSRSSSQSSGFESQTSGYQRNIFLQPPSREESICREEDKPMHFSDRYQNHNVSRNCFYQVAQFSRHNSPIYPKMNFNGHVHIPQPRYNGFSPNVFSRTPQTEWWQQYRDPRASTSTPKFPNLIKLPQVDSFQSN